uniref:Uncharacterized protein n=1 Tax=Rhinolophus ferrumequinum TaxID=59479 RepID=A0A671G9F4_RHIFE
MSVPVEQLEISIPQGYGLFIKTIFQASSFTESLELLFQVQIEYLVSLPNSPPPQLSAPLYLAIHGEFFPFPIGGVETDCCFVLALLLL